MNDISESSSDSCHYKSSRKHVLINESQYVNTNRLFFHLQQKFSFIISFINKDETSLQIYNSHIHNPFMPAACIFFMWLKHQQGPSHAWSTSRHYGVHKTANLTSFALTFSASRHASFTFWRSNWTSSEINITHLRFVITRFLNR